MQCNKHIEALAPSRSIVFMAKAKQLQAQDASIISLAGGEPDFDTPKAICEELNRQIAAGYTHYTVGPGLPELRQRIARKLREENGCDYSPDGIIVTPGGKFAIYLAVRSMINAGDEVMYLEPGWVSYPSIIEASGGVPVPVRLCWDEDFRITARALEEKCTSRTRMLIINCPNNPTGRNLSREEAEQLRAFMLAHPDVLLLADEIYERIVFDGSENVSMGSFPDVARRVITVNGFSKSVAMTGWRVGYLACDVQLQKVMYKLFQHTMTCVSGFIQKACVTALDCTEEIEAMRLRYAQRRDMFIGALNKIPGVSYVKNHAAFYLFPKIDTEMYGITDDRQLAMDVLHGTGVLFVPGSGFDWPEPDHLRLVMLPHPQTLTKAMEDIGRFLETYRQR